MITFHSELIYTPQWVYIYLGSHDIQDNRFCCKGLSSYITLMGVDVTLHHWYIE
jgi:hypothetical protein